MSIKAGKHSAPGAVWLTMARAFVGRTQTPRGTLPWPGEPQSLDSVRTLPGRFVLCGAWVRAHLDIAGGLSGRPLSRTPSTAGRWGPWGKGPTLRAVTLTIRGLTTPAYPFVRTRCLSAKRPENFAATARSCVGCHKRRASVPGKSWSVFVGVGPRTLKTVNETFRLPG